MDARGYFRYDLLYLSELEPLRESARMSMPARDARRGASVGVCSATDGIGDRVGGGARALASGRASGTHAQERAPKFMHAFFSFLR